jgi:hypothetical protein
MLAEAEVAVFLQTGQVELVAEAMLRLAEMGLLELLIQAVAAAEEVAQAAAEQVETAVQVS